MKNNAKDVQISSQSNCPDDQQLFFFLHAELSENDRDQVIKHISSCLKCMRALAEMRQRIETLPPTYFDDLEQEAQKFIAKVTSDNPLIILHNGEEIELEEFSTPPYGGKRKFFLPASGNYAIRTIGDEVIFKLDDVDLYTTEEKAEAAAAANKVQPDFTSQNSSLQLFIKKGAKEKFSPILEVEFL